MRALLLASLIALGCADEAAWTPGSPPGPGGTGGSGRIDARPPGGDGDGGAGRVSGRVCELTDLRVRGCAPLRASGLTVSIASTGVSATVADDGTYSLPADGAVLVVTAGDAVFFGAAGRGGDLHLVPRTRLETITAISRVNQPPGDGLVVVHVDRAGTPLAGVTGGVVAGVEPLYDSDDPDQFVAGGPTGAGGTIVYAGVPPGTARVTTSATSTAVDAPVVAGALTRVSISAP